MLTNIFSSLIFPGLFAYSLKTAPFNPGLSLYVSAAFALAAAILFKRHLDAERQRETDLPEELQALNHDYPPLDALDGNNTFLGTDDHLFVTSISSHHATPRRGQHSSSKNSNNSNDMIQYEMLQTPSYQNGSSSNSRSR